MRRTASTLVTAVALLCAGRAAATDAPPDGAALYASCECAECHERGEARPLGELSQRYDVERLTRLLQTPPPGMPRFDLSDEERRSLAEYLLATFP